MVGNALEWYDVSSRHGLLSGERHHRALRGGWVLHNRATAAIDNMPQTYRSIIVSARQHDTDCRAQIGVGGGTERDVDRWAAEPNEGVGRQREVTILEQHVIVGRGYVNAARQQRLLVLDLHHRHRGYILQQRCEKIVDMAAS